MSEIRSKPAARGAADCLSLAAAPAFAAMTVLTEAVDGGAAGILCSPAPATIWEPAAADVFEGKAITTGGDDVGVEQRARCSS